MHIVKVKQAEKDFKHFARDKIPKSVYKKNCNVTSEDSCGGYGNTCAPEDAPGKWQDVIDDFIEDSEYEKQDIREFVDEWKTDLEYQVPA